MRASPLEIMVYEATFKNLLQDYKGDNRRNCHEERLLKVRGPSSRNCKLGLPLKTMVACGLPSESTTRPTLEIINLSLPFTTQGPHFEILVHETHHQNYNVGQPLKLWCVRSTLESTRWAPPFGNTKWDSLRNYNLEPAFRKCGAWGAPLEIREQGAPLEVVVCVAYF